MDNLRSLIYGETAESEPSRQVQDPTTDGNPDLSHGAVALSITKRKRKPNKRKSGGQPDASSDSVPPAGGQNRRKRKQKQQKSSENSSQPDHADDGEISASTASGIDGSKPGSFAVLYKEGSVIDLMRSEVVESSSQIGKIGTGYKRSDSSKKRRRTVLNWKRRRVDFREEVDIGGSVLHAVRNFQLHRIQPESKTTGQQSALSSSTNAAVDMTRTEEKTIQPTADDTSDEEQEAIMNRLLGASQSQQAQTETQRDKLDDFWGKGLTRPKGMTTVMGTCRQKLPQSVMRKKCLAPSSSTSMPLAQEYVPSASKKMKLATIKELPVEIEKLPADPFEIFPFRERDSPQPIANLQPGNRTFLHQRQFIRTAARHVASICAPENNIQRSTNDHILRILWNCDLSKAHWKRVVLDQARRACRRFYDFATADSNSQRHLVDLLGLMPLRQAYGPIREVGNNLARPPMEGVRTLDLSKLRGTNGWISFMALPGTVPPAPTFPLDVTSFVFGSVDRNWDNDHSSTWDETSYVLTIALLLGRSVAARQGENLWKENELYETIHNYVSDLVTHSAEKIHQRGRSKQAAISSLEEPPLVRLNDSLILSASVMANMWKNKHEDSNQGPSMTLKMKSKAISEMLDSYMDRHCLRPFGRLRILHGLHSLSSALPESGMAILSQSFGDSNTLRTPFDLMRDLVHHLEHAGYLDGDADEEGSVSVPMLEYAFYQSAASFRLAVEADPTEPFSHAWHIAALAVCLLLCSGNCIDAVARRFPSQRSDDSEQDIESDRLLLPHEVRVKLNKFEDLRKDLTAAADHLLDLAKHQKSCRASLSVSSLLEWRQVMALLVGNLTEETCYSIRKLHSFHSTTWALMDKSPIAQEYLKNHLDVSENDRMELLAQCLEDDPENINIWRCFVEQLGNRPQTKEEGCVHLAMDSCQDDSELRRGAGECRTWVRQRAHWQNDLLSCEIQETLNVGDDERVILQRAKDVLEGYPRDPSMSVQSNLSRPAECDGQGLLRSIIDFGTSELEPSKQDRQKDYDSDLPQHFSSVVSGESLNTASFAGSLPHIDGVGEDLEVLCYKVFIFSHMGLPQHQSLDVQLILKHLCIRCWDAASRSIQVDMSEWRCIVWLHCKGLGITVPPISTAMEPSDDTTESAACEQPTSATEASSNVEAPADTKRTEYKKRTGCKSDLNAFTDEMRAAVIEGMERFGNKWGKIQVCDSSLLLQGLSFGLFLTSLFGVLTKWILSEITLMPSRDVIDASVNTATCRYENKLSPQAKASCLSVNHLTVVFYSTKDGKSWYDLPSPR